MRSSDDLRGKVLALYNAEFGPAATMTAYTAPQPASPEVAPAGAELYTFALANPALAEPAEDGTIPFRPIADVAAIAPGTPAFFRIKAAGVAVADISAAELGNPGPVLTGIMVKATNLALNLDIGS